MKCLARSMVEPTPGFAPDREAKSRPRVTVGGWPRASHSVWEGTPDPCARTHYQVRLHDLAYHGAAMYALAHARVVTAFFPWLRGWWSPQNNHTDLRAAGCVCRDCQSITLHVYVIEEEWTIVHREVVDGKESKN